MSKFDADVIQLQKTISEPDEAIIPVSVQKIFLDRLRKLTDQRQDRKLLGAVQYVQMFERIKAMPRSTYEHFGTAITDHDS